MRLIYYGTPALAVPPLERLVADGRAPLLVVTRADRPRGRGLRSGTSAVRGAAEALGLPVATPERAGAPSEIERIRSLSPDLIVLVAYGQMLPAALLEAPRIGALNVHFSLLPLHRGASPIQSAILAGDRDTGVTTMWMSEALDQGPTYLSLAVPIGEDENAGALGGRLAILAADALAETIDRIKRGEIVRKPQDDARASYAPKLSADTGRLTLNRPAEEMARRVRAFTPEPGAYLDLGTVRLRVLEAAVGGAADVVPGTIVDINPREGIGIALARGSLWLRRVHPSGRRPMSGFDYANGARLKPGDRLPLAPARS